MNKTMKKAAKFALGTCTALSVVTLGAVFASSAAVKVVAESMKAGLDTMQKTMAELRAENHSSTAAEEITPADFIDTPSEII